MRGWKSQSVSDAFTKGFRQRHLRNSICRVRKFNVRSLTDSLSSGEADLDLGAPNCRDGNRQRYGSREQDIARTSTGRTGLGSDVAADIAVDAYQLSAVLTCLVFEIALCLGSVVTITNRRDRVSFGTSTY